jgi:hypothetical protein
LVSRLDGQGEKNADHVCKSCRVCQIRWPWWQKASATQTKALRRGGRCACEENQEKKEQWYGQGQEASKEFQAQARGSQGGPHSQAPQSRESDGTKASSSQAREGKAPSSPSSSSRSESGSAKAPSPSWS